MRCRRLKPGSLTASGIVVGIIPPNGNPFEVPVLVPRDYGVTLRHTLGRSKALSDAGWRMCPAALMTRIPESDQTFLIHKDSRAFQTWLALPPERRRAGAAR